MRTLVVLFGILFHAAAPALELGADPRFTAIETLVCRPVAAGGGDGHAARQPPYEVLAGTFPVDLATNRGRRIVCDFLVPMNRKDGVPIALARDVLLLFPWPGRQWLRSGNSAWEYAATYGFTVMTLDFLDHDQDDPEDATGYYIRPASGSAAAWEHAIRRVCRCIGLDEHTKVFALGQSAGGSAAQLFASAHPERIDGLVVLSGRTFDLGNPYAGPTVLLHATEDRGEENTALQRILEAKRAPVSHYAVQPNWLAWKEGYGWAHTVNADAWRFAVRYLGALCRQRSQTGSSYPNDRWKPVPGGLLPDDAACRSAWTGMIRQPDVRTDPDRPALVTFLPLVAAKGSVVWIDRRYGVTADDLVRMAYVFESEGYAFAGIGGGDGSDSVTALASRISQIKGLSRPMHCCLVHPERQDAVLRAIGGVKSIFLIDPSLGDLKDNAPPVATSYGIVGHDFPEPGAGWLILRRGDSGNAFKWTRDTATLVLSAVDASKPAP